MRNLALATTIAAMLGLTAEPASAGEEYMNGEHTCPSGYEVVLDVRFDGGVEVSWWSTDWRQETVREMESSYTQNEYVHTNDRTAHWSVRSTDVYPNDTIYSVNEYCFLD